MMLSVLFAVSVLFFPALSSITYLTNNFLDKNQCVKKMTELLERTNPSKLTLCPCLKEAVAAEVQTSPKSPGCKYRIIHLLDGSSFFDFWVPLVQRHSRGLFCN